ncbi:MAG: DUF4369 domain-containing protein [Dysgonamonadaceae bacterium]|jgi:hypothetical protein|nr:DUF4369 domain-containing protein [Dysgonamonadaceae bacterium]
MKKILSLTLILVVLIACSSKPKYELEVNITNNSSLIGAKMELTQKIEGETVYADTVKIKKGNFRVDIPYENAALLFVTIPNATLMNVMIVAEEGKVSLNIDGDKVKIGGTPLNDRLQTFYNGNDSVSLLFNQLEEKYSKLGEEGLATPETGIQYSEERNQLLKKNTDRIILFTKENVDNQLGEYFFVSNYFMSPVERRLEMNLFMTDRIKKQLGFE